MKRIAILALAVALLLVMSSCTITIPSLQQPVLPTNAPAVAPTDSTAAPTIAPPMPTEPVAEPTEPATEPTEPEDQTDPTAPTSTEPKNCQHVYSDATCSKPATCTLCGASSGEALGHNFAGGNCATPAACTRCGEKSTGNGEHQYSGGKCNICGAADGRYEQVKAALKAAERYPKYIKINYDLISNEYDLFNMTKQAKYFSDAHKHALEIHDWLQDIVDRCGDYKELNMLTEECQELILEMPIVPGSSGTSAMRSYISDARSFARDASRISVIYNVLCKSYDLPGV